MAVDALGMPVRAIVTSATVADCKKAIELISDFPTKYLLADKGYDSNEIVDFAEKFRINVVISPKNNRLYQRKSTAPYTKNVI